MDIDKVHDVYHNASQMTIKILQYIDAENVTGEDKYKIRLALASSLISANIDCTMDYSDMLHDLNIIIDDIKKNCNKALLYAKHKMESE